MSAKSWTEVKRLLAATLDLDPEERPEFLGRHCAEDEELRLEIEGYLEREVEVENFIEQPLVDLHPVSPLDSLEGQRIGPWHLEQRIGHGGMGLVYRARRADKVYEQQVAVKVLKRGLDTDEIVRRFERERQILANLEHPHIARVLDGGATGDGLPYFVMEYVEGQPIDRYCSERDLDLEAILNLFRIVCEAVHFAHQNLVVHCDLKPANIMIAADGSPGEGQIGGFPKLLDFGIARLLRPDGEAGETRHSWRFGTPEYASPEQERGQALTTASDGYSLGVVLYRLLTGQNPRPVSGDPPMPIPKPSTAARRALAATGADDRSRRGAETWRWRLKGDLDTIVLKAMHLEPERRYASAAELAEDLRRYLAKEPVTARPDTPLYRFRKFLRRHPLSTAAGSVMLILVFGFMGLLSFQLQATQAQRDRALLLRDAFLALLETIDLSKRRVSSEVAGEALEKALRTEFSSDPTDRALLLDRMGRVYYRFGQLDEALRLLEESLRLRRASPAMDEASIAGSLNNLGLVLIHLGQVSEGITRVRQALEIHTRLGDQLAILHDLTNLATGLEKSGQYPEAEGVYRRVLKRKRALGKDDEELANSLNNLANVLIRRGKLKEAEPLLRQALQIYRKHLGAESPRVATVLVNLAVLLDAREDSRAAIGLVRQALAIRRQHVPESHPNIARTLAVLAFSLLASGRPAELAEAETLYREAVNVYLAERGPDHPDTLVLQRNLAATLISRGKLEEAEVMARDVAERSFRILPLDHWRIADARSVLGHSLLAQGRYAEAERLVVGSYPLICSVKGEDSRYEREAREHIVTLYRRWGKEKLAQRYMVFHGCMSRGGESSTNRQPTDPSVGMISFPDHGLRITETDLREISSRQAMLDGLDSRNNGQAETPSEEAEIEEDVGDGAPPDQGHDGARRRGPCLQGEAGDGDRRALLPQAAPRRIAP